MDNFVRMHGLQNKFVMLKGPKRLSATSVIDLARKYGKEAADGVIIVSPVSDSKIRMKYWNADGSIAEMCGNGLRCAVRFAVDQKMIEPGRIVVMTDAGELKADWDGVDEDKIEVQVGKVTIKTTPLEINGTVFYEANVGNPHALTIVSNIEHAPVKTLGPVIELDPHFPNRTNVEFIKLRTNNEIDMRTWERGVGETMACGTGMAAAANVAVTIAKKDFPITVNVLGGNAKVWIDQEGYTRILGPAKAIA